jgi:septum formation protein
MAQVSRYLKWPPLVLASGSPRRRQLLEALGADFVVVPPQVSEEGLESMAPEAAVRKLARDKALEVSRRLKGPARRRIILAADTVVAYRHHVLGKPRDPADAVRMLGMLSGKWHQVYTGICLIEGRSGKMHTGYECSRVKFRRLSPEYISNYVASGEPLDKAGSYGIQQLGALLVEQVEGCYFNVVGLPLVRLDRMLKRIAGNK